MIFCKNNPNPNPEEKKKTPHLSAVSHNFFDKLSLQKTLLQLLRRYEREVLHEILNSGIFSTNVQTARSHTFLELPSNPIYYLINDESS